MKMYIVIAYATLDHGPIKTFNRFAFTWSAEGTNEVLRLAYNYVRNRLAVEHKHSDVIASKVLLVPPELGHTGRAIAWARDELVMHTCS